MKQRKIKTQIPHGDIIHGVHLVPDEPAATPALIVLGHGVSNNMKHPLMKRISQELVGMGFEVALFNFPFAQERKTKPDPEPVLVGAMEFVAKAARDERDIRLILGGKSLGARIAALTISMGYVCDGALFLGFPLHLPEKNLDNRDELLREVNVPMLFIQGTRDIFCHLDLLQNTLGRLDAPSTLHLIEGAEHSYVVKNRSQRDVYTEIVQVIDRWLKDI